MHNVLRNVYYGMVLYVDFSCSLRINRTTQRYIVVLCCIMIKVAVEVFIVLLKGGERGAYRRAYLRSLF